MCGLIFAMTEDVYATNVDDFLYDAFLASQVRGLHSSGLFQLDKNKQAATIKRALCASEFLQLQNVHNMLKDSCRLPLTVGHVRHATAGSVKDENAHPFSVKRQDGTIVTGVHNGTLRGWKEKEGGKEHEVDSAWAFQKLADEGPIDAFEYFNGAFAMIWHDSKDPDFVYMTRNNERPLHYFQSADGRTILGASELGMLGWLADKHGFKRRADKEQQFFYLPDDKVLKFSLKNIGEVETYSRPKYDPKTTPTPPPVAMVPRSHHNYNYPQQNRNYGDRYNGRYGADGWDDPWDPADWTSESYGTASRGQVAVISRVKEVLREARQLQYKKIYANDDTGEALDDRVIGSDVLESRLERGIREAIENHAKAELDPWYFVSNTKFLLASEIDGKNASHAERAAATGARVLGKIMAFSGVLYDDETGDTYGDAYVMVNGTSTTVDCIVRGLSKQAAEKLYIEKTNPIPMAVSGLMDGIVQGAGMYILTPITTEQRGWLSRNINQTANASVN